MNEQILTTVEAALRCAGVLRPEATLLVALSGGADSVALLRAVCALGMRHGFFTRAAHVEHGLRGEASVEDARFCERLCAELGVPFTLDAANLSGGMAASGAEARAREVRYRLLFARARECGADALLLAHHLDDQAETVLSHLVRGSGARGLGGMRETSCVNGVLLVRPLLSLSKADLLAALDGLPYRVDASNAEPCCQRNRLRMGALPLLMAENPRAAAHIAQSAALLSMDEDCLQMQADVLLTHALIDEPPFLCVRKVILLAAPDAVAVRALRGFALRGMAYLAAEAGASVRGQTPADEPMMERTGFSLLEERTLSAGDSLALLMLLRTPEGGSLNLPHGLRVDATVCYLHLTRMAEGAPVAKTPARPPMRLDSGMERVRFGGFTFRLSAFDPVHDSAPDGVHAVALTNAMLSQTVLRTKDTDDRIHPFGTGGGKPLRRYLIDHKLDLPFRAHLPLLCMDSEVLWAVGIGAAEGTRITDGPSTRIAIEGHLPWTSETLREAARHANQTNMKE